MAELSDLASCRDPEHALALALYETEGEWRGCGSASFMAKVVWPVMEARLASPPTIAEACLALAKGLEADGCADALSVASILRHHAAHREAGR